MKIRPELGDIRYWIHLFIISSIILGILQLWQGGDMFNFFNIFVGGFLILAGDVVAHTILGLD